MRLLGSLGCALLRVLSFSTILMDFPRTRKKKLLYSRGSFWPKNGWTVWRCLFWSDFLGPFIEATGVALSSSRKRLEPG